VGCTSLASVDTPADISRTCWILLRPTEAARRAVTGYAADPRACAVAELDRARGTSRTRAVGGAVAATALTVLLTLLPRPLTLVGSSLTDAQ
jgi:hypothetical protein